MCLFFYDSYQSARVAQKERRAAVFRTIDLNVKVLCMKSGHIAINLTNPIFPALDKAAVCSDDVCRCAVCSPIFCCVNSELTNKVPPPPT